MASIEVELNIPVIIEKTMSSGHPMYPILAGLEPSYETS